MEQIEVSNTLADTAVEAGQVAEHASDSGIHFALAADKLGEFLGIPITNTLITSWIVMAILVTIALLVGSQLKMVPGKLQLTIEEMISYILNYMEEVLESRKLAKKLFPLITTIFLFIFASNILEFTPGIGSIGFVSHWTHGTEFIPLLRSVNTDLNVTLALAIIAFMVIEVVGVMTLGVIKYAKKFINFSSPLKFIVGIIELFSEVARLISFSFRLFGNILAGEILILVVIFFVPYLLPVPMMLFEVFVGFIQAAIFALLTLFFIKIAITEPH